MDDKLLDRLTECDEALHKLAARSDDASSDAGAAVLLELVDCARRLRWADSQPPDAGPGADGPRIGRFVIERELGCGGLGIVSLAFDPRVGRRVALKTPLPHALAMPDLWRRFQTEVDAAARLSHPNIVPVHEVGEDGPIGYIVSEYCPAGSLADWLRRPHDPVEPRAAARFVAELAAAVQHAHGRGVLHRDIKPSNVLLAVRNTERAEARPTPTTDEGAAPLALERLTPRLADFGMAKLLDADTSDRTRTGALVGTPAYMAPEQAEGRSDVDARTDVYALGAILYELLTGKPPHQGATDVDTLRRLATEEAAPPRRVRKDIPRDLEAICLKCLARQPNRRYATADALARDLGRFVRGMATDARPVGPIESSWRWMRRRPVAALAVAILLIVVTTFASIVTNYNASLRQATSDAERFEDSLNDALDVQYASDMRLAADAVGKGDIETARLLLSKYDPADGERDLRTFAWNYLDGRMRQRDNNVLLRHTGPLFAAAYSPDGKTLVAAGAGGVVYIWDVQERRVRHKFSAHSKDVNDIAFSPDSSRFATASDDGTAQVFETYHTTRNRLLGRRGDVPLIVVVFSEDGRLIAAGGSGRAAMVYDAETCELVGSVPHSDSVQELVFTEDSSLLLVGGGRYIRILDVRDVITHSDAVKPLLSARKDSYCIGGLSKFRNNKGFAQVFLSMIKDEREAFSQSGAAISCVSYSDDGGWLGICGHAGFMVCEAGCKNLPEVNHDHASRVRETVFSPDNQRVATVGDDGTLREWRRDGTSDVVDLAWPERRYAESIQFSRDGSRLGICSGNLHVYDMRSGRRRFDKVSVGTWAFSPDGLKVACASSAFDGLIEVYDILRRRMIGNLRSPEGRVDAIAFNTDGDFVIFEHSNGALGVWTFASGASVQWIDDRGGNSGISMSVKDASRFCRRRNGRATMRAPDNLALIALDDLALDVQEFAITPDKSMLIGGTFRGELVVWDTASWRIVSRLAGHRGSVVSVDVSPDGSTVVSTSNDETIGMWDLRSLQHVGNLPIWSSEGARAVAAELSPDGSKLAINMGVPRSYGVLRFLRTSPPEKPSTPDSVSRSAN